MNFIAAFEDEQAPAIVALQGKIYAVPEQGSTADLNR